MKRLSPLFFLFFISQTVSASCGSTLWQQWGIYRAKSPWGELQNQLLSVLEPDAARESRLNPLIETLDAFVKETLPRRWAVTQIPILAGILESWDAPYVLIAYPSPLHRALNHFANDLPIFRRHAHTLAAESLARLRSVQSMRILGHGFIHQDPLLIARLTNLVYENPGRATREGLRLAVEDMEKAAADLPADPADPGEKLDLGGRRLKLEQAVERIKAAVSLPE